MFSVTPFRTLVIAAIAWAGLTTGAGTALAEDIDAVSDKLDRVERDLRELQYEVYKGHPPASQPGGAPGTPANAARINDLEEALRELRGQVETMAFQMRQMQEQLELSRRETNFRRPRGRSTCHRDTPGRAAGDCTGGSRTQDTQRVP
jgi:TolA-binding protein